MFSCLSIYPGTIDFHDAEKAGWLDREAYFTGRFQELKIPFDVAEEDARWMNEWFEENRGLQRCYEPTVEDCRAILKELGEHHAAHLDLSGALFRAGDWEGAEHHAQRALDLGLPVPGLAHNLLACVAAQRFDLKRLQQELRTALREDPYHFVVAKNAEALRSWLVAGGPVHGTPLHLDPHHEFQLFERTQQPTLPGPLPDDWAQWQSPRELPASQSSISRRHLQVLE